MKKNLHPEYNSRAKAVCACGHTFETGSTVKEIKTELCSKCHPFYTGKQKLVDTARRVEKFEARVKAGKASASVRDKKTKRATRSVVKLSEKKDKK